LLEIERHARAWPRQPGNSGVARGRLTAGVHDDIAAVERLVKEIIAALRADE
jgi:hypothetical protein